MKAHFKKETHLENESMFLEKWKVINPFLNQVFGVLITGHVANQDVLLLATLRY